VPDTFPDLPSGSRACFRITAGINRSVPPGDTARAYRASLRVTGDGVAGFNAERVYFVVPGATCAGDPGGVD
jgi:hypothetical protein